MGRLQEYPVTLAEVVGKIRELRKEVRLLTFWVGGRLVALYSSKYSPDVAAIQRPGLEHWQESDNRLILLQQANYLFEEAAKIELENAFILGNQANCGHLPGIPEDGVRVKLNAALKIGKQTIHGATLDDSAIHTVAEKDVTFRTMLDEIWEHIEASGAA